MPLEHIIRRQETESRQGDQWFVKWVTHSYGAVRKMSIFKMPQLRLFEKCSA
jgi:hypothetical protein